MQGRLLSIKQSSLRRFHCRLYPNTGCQLFGGKYLHWMWTKHFIHSHHVAVQKESVKPETPPDFILKVTIEDTQFGFSSTNDHTSTTSWMSFPNGWSWSCSLPQWTSTVQELGMKWTRGGGCWRRDTTDNAVLLTWVPTRRICPTFPMTSAPYLFWTTHQEPMALTRGRE